MNINKFIYTILGGTLILTLILSLIIISLYVVYIVALWKLFKKAGKNGWEALIPFYNTYVLIEISGLNWWYFLIAISGTILSFFNIEILSPVFKLAASAVNFFAFYNIAKRMKVSPIGYAIAAIFVKPIIVMILGFSNNYSYDKTIPVSKNGPIEQENNARNNEAKERFCLSCGCKVNEIDKYCTNCGKKIKK